MHSPFVYEFIRDVMNDKNSYPAYQKTESLRQNLLQNYSVLQVEDFGAGSSVTRNSSRTISSIAKNAAKSKKLGQLLFRIARHYQPIHVLELGTSLGITTSYLSQAVPGARVITMEGASSIASVAAKNFQELNLSNIELVRGNFDQTLKQVLESVPTIDLAFIDGNHRKAPTLEYFEQLLQHAHEQTLLVFDDIHWSEEMEAAWHTIQQHPQVTLTIDLFFIGIVSINPGVKAKQHFVIRY